jgi:uncharacterized protein
VRVLELWRYPVKSLQGERLDSATVTAEGFAGDRRFAIFDLDTGFGLTARRVPELLFASARWRDDGTVDITLPDGSIAADDHDLSAWLGRRVALRAAADDITRSYENPNRIADDAETNWAPYNGARGPFHDSARARVSLVSTASLGSWDRRRFRANVVLDGDGEDDLVGANVTLGDVELDIRKHIDRCVMTTRPQPGGIERDLDVLRTINRERAGRIAIGALVVRAGTVRVGDEFHA